MLIYHQLRVTAAEPGRVDFELDIQKEHTVGATPVLPNSISLNQITESFKHHSWGNHCQYGYEPLRPQLELDPKIPLS